VLFSVVTTAAVNMLQNDYGNRLNGKVDPLDMVLCVLDVPDSNLRSKTDFTDRFILIFLYFQKDEL
jgi:hypothetical protein